MPNLSLLKLWACIPFWLIQSVMIRILLVESVTNRTCSTQNSESYSRETDKVRSAEIENCVLIRATLFEKALTLILGKAPGAYLTYLMSLWHYRVQIPASSHVF